LRLFEYDVLTYAVSLKPLKEGPWSLFVQWKRQTGDLELPSVR